MRFITSAAIALSLSLTLPGFTLAQTGHDLFQQALVKERADGDLSGAIELYQLIAGEFTQDRALAAKALVQLGRCHEKLGSAEAQQAYRRVVEDYADQTDMAAEARTRLTALERLARPETRTSQGPPGLVTRRVWGDPPVGADGSLSANGRYLSFTDWANANGNLAIHDFETDRDQHLTDDATGTTDWANRSVISADGKHVVYSWYRDGFYELRIVNADGTHPRVLHRSSAGWHIEPSDWSKDGRSILASEYHGYPPSESRIVTVSVADGLVRVVKELGTQLPTTMSFSPNATYIAYDYPPSDTAQQHDLYAIAVEGSAQVPLVEHPANDYVLDWALDGESVLFASDRTGRWAVWSLPIADGGRAGSPIFIKENMGRLTPLGFSQGGAFFYGVGGWASDVYTATVDVAAGEVREQPTLAVQRNMGSNFGPTWSPDGKSLAYVSKQSPGATSAVAYVVRIKSLSTGVERELRPELAWFRGPRWSPEGQSFLVTGFDPQNRRGVYRIDAAIGETRPILQAETDSWVETVAPEWSHDGKSVLYVRRGSSNEPCEIVSRELETRAETQITRLPVRNACFAGLALSQNGRMLAVRTWHEDPASMGLAVLPSAGGALRELVRVYEPERILEVAWSHDSRYVLLTRTSDEPRVKQVLLQRISIDGGEAVNLSLGSGVIRGLSIHPDGRRIAFDQRRFKSEIWVMEGLEEVLGRQD